MLMRYDPFRELDRWTQHMFGPMGRSQVMPMDAYRRGDRFMVHFDLPGVDPDTIELTIEKNVLTVKAERSWPTEEGDELLVTERAQGSFSRQLFLSDSLDADRIEARYDQGVLTLRIPVAEAAKPRKVTITKGGGAKKTIEAKTAA